MSALPPAQSLRQHLPMLVVALVVVVAAFVLQVNADGERVALNGTPSVMVPPLCLTNAYLGLKCPGCGLTRSFIHLAHGDILASIRAHRLGWLLAGLVLAQIPYRLHEIARPGKARALVWFGQWVLWVFVVLMLVNWAGELLFFRA